ncbi:MAG: hypothetical protein NT039_00405 [Candidatus Berkelbacteria bacterium]|nr:hypothetical protein [Candidatus Berkelbacteria bacterium]
MPNEIELSEENNSLEKTQQPMEQTTTPKIGFFNNPKKVKGVFVLLIILTVLFFLAAGVLGYLYWKKNDNYKRSNQENQQQLDKVNKEKADLEKQIADLKKENEDLKNSGEKSTAEAANKEAIVKAYTEVLAYVASVIDKYQGFDNWTEADYQKGLEIAKKTQSSSFLETCQWAWTRKDISQMTRFVRFLNEVASGINDNLP